MDLPVTVSERAQQHIKRQLEQTESQYLRLGLKESGCNGYMYTLDFLQEPSEADHCYDVAPGVRVCVAEDDLAQVIGTEVDMVTEGLNSALVFKNPNAQSYCGCGESFALGGEPPSFDVGDAGELATNVGGQGQEAG
jgi:iron-sulfur cluster assembly accessory protein